MTSLERWARDLKIKEARLDMLRLQDRQMLEAQLKPGLTLEENVELWAWCKNGRAGCSDKQERVLGTRTTVNLTYRDRGGDETGPMASLICDTQVSFDFQDDADRYCKGCGAHRQIGDQERPTYDPVSGFPQDGLLKIMRGWVQDGFKPPTEIGSVFPGVKPDDRVEALEKELAELRALVKPQSVPAPVPEGSPAVEVPEPAEGHGPAPDATDTRVAEGDPPTVDASWSTIERNIHVRTRANGSQVFRVKVAGKLHSPIGTLEEARKVRDEMLEGGA